MNEFQDLIPDFLDEANEHLDNIEDDILIMDSSVEKGEKTDSEVINRIFRAIHSIKGGSSFVGFQKIEELSHKMEDLLNFIRNGDINPKKNTINILFKSIDKLKEMIENASESNSMDVSVYIKELLFVTNEGLGTETKKSVETIIHTKDVFEDVDFSISQYTLERRLDKGNLYLLRVDTINDLEGKGKSSIDFISDLVSFGEIIDSHIDLENITETTLPIHFLYFTMLEYDLVTASFSIINPSNIIVLDKSKLTKLFKDKKTKTVSEIPKETKIEPVAPPPPAPSPTPTVPDNLDIPIDSPEQEESFSAQEVMSDSNLDEEDSDWDQYNEFVTFFIAEEQYAVPIFMVQEIKEMQPFSELPNQPEYVIGVINLRGNVVPIFDLRKKLGLVSKEFDKFTVILLLNVSGKLKGCVVDAINDVIMLEHEDKQTTPMFSRSINTDYIKFIGREPSSSSFLIVLNIEKIFSGD